MVRKLDFLQRYMYFCGGIMEIWHPRIYLSMDHPPTTELNAGGVNCMNNWGKFFKFQLQQLLEQGLYDREDENDRKILAYVFIPIVQREVDLFVELWNNSRTRFQRNTLMPDGIPNVIYDSPEEYNLEDKVSI